MLKLKDSEPTSLVFLGLYHEPNWDVELNLGAEHRNGLPVPGAQEYYTLAAGEGLGASNSWWVPLPYSLAPIVLPLQPPIQPCQCPHYHGQPRLTLPESPVFPCAKRQEGPSWPSDPVCVCKAEDNLVCHMGPKELQSSRHKGGFQQAAERVHGTSQIPPCREEAPVTVKHVLASQFKCTALPSVSLELPPSAWSWFGFVR